MHNRAEKLHQCIARYERYLREGVSADLAEIYRAEIVAAKAMLDERMHPTNRWTSSSAIARRNQFHTAVRPGRASGRSRRHDDPHGQGRVLVIPWRKR